MKKLDVRFAVVITGLLLNLVANIACEQKNEDGSDATTLSGSFSSGASISSKANEVALSGANSLDLTSYYIYCVSFEDTPKVSRGDISAAGSFSLEIPVGVPLGCFVNDAASNLSVATFVLKDVSAGTENTSMTPNASIELGQVNLDLEKGEVVVPKERVVGAVTEDAGVSFDAESELHDKSYTMSCINTGSVERDAACANMVSGDGGNVYFRVLRAVEDGENVQGLGVWASKTDYQNCGSVDMTAAERADIESDGVVFDMTRLNSGNFINDPSVCELRDSDRGLTRDNIRKYFALGKLENEGGYRKMRMKDRFDYGSGCTRVDKTVIHFQPKEAGVFLGHFWNRTYWEENNQGDCGNRQEETGDVIIRFTQN